MDGDGRGRAQIESSPTRSIVTRAAVGCCARGSSRTPFLNGVNSQTDPLVLLPLSLAGQGGTSDGGDPPGKALMLACVHRGIFLLDHIQGGMHEPGHPIHPTCHLGELPTVAR